MMLTAYIVASTVANGFIASIWSSKVGLNALIKLVFVGMAVVGAICAAAQLGIRPS